MKYDLNNNPQFVEEETPSSPLTLKTKKRHINPRTENQGKLIEAMNTNEMVFGLGPAGTGKTFLAVATEWYVLKTTL